MGKPPRSSSELHLCRASARKASSASLSLTLLLAASANGVALAEARVSAAPHLEVTVAESVESRALFEPVLRELLARQPISFSYLVVPELNATLILHPPPAVAPTFARVWIDLAGTGAASVYLLDSSGNRMLVRHVHVPDRIDEVTREEVAHIVESSVEALLGGAEIGVVPAESHRPPPPPPHPRARFALGAGYDARIFGGSSPLWHGPRVDARLRLPAAEGRWSLALSSPFRFAKVLDDAPAGARFDSVGIRAGAALDLWSETRSFVSVGAGLGADLVRLEPRHVGEQAVTLEATRWVASPLAAVELSFGFRPSSELILILNLSADADVLDTRYVLERSMGNEVVFHPWVVRPGLSLSLLSGSY